MSEDLLAQDITLVISTKDQINRINHTLSVLLPKLPPQMKVIYVSVQIGNNYETQQVRKYQATYPNLSIIESGLNFASPFTLRNLAIPHVQTKYVLFMFNDVTPCNDRWLQELYQTAEEHPGGMIFQPFIWEKKKNTVAFHAAWDNLYFVESDHKFLTIHTFDHNLKQNGIQSLQENFDPQLQPYHIEDHIFMARTDFMKHESIMDPKASYTKEYLDLILTMKYRQAEVWFVPRSEVLYTLPFGEHITQDDILYYVFRRSEEPAYQSVKYIEQKWGIEYNYDGIGKSFMKQGIANLKWDHVISQDKFKHLELILAMFVAIGYNRFKLTMDEHSSDHYLKLPEFYKQIVNQTSSDTFSIQLHQQLPNSDSDSGSDSGSSSGSGSGSEHEKHLPRREALHRGDLFPVIKDTRTSLGTYTKQPVSDFFGTFAVIKISWPDTRGAIPDVWPASLIIRNQRDSQAEIFLHFPNLIIKNVPPGQSFQLFGISVPHHQINIYHDTIDDFTFDPTHSTLEFWAWEPIPLDSLHTILRFTD